jgi:predicted peptidase
MIKEESKMSLYKSKSFGFIKKEIHYEYLYFAPKVIKQKMPVLIYLHGAGERENDISQLEGMFPIGILEAHFGELPFFVVTPHCTLEHGMWDSDGIKLLIDSFFDQNGHSLDKGRIYLMGHSMGGRACWNFATDYPDVLAAVAPIAGYSCYLKAHKMINVPTMAFHGQNDKVVPVEETYKMICAIQEAGGTKARSVVAKNSDHGGIVTHSIHNERLYEWFLNKSKKED